MSRVRYASIWNSTHFTTCCSVAILDYEQRCPKCKQDVYPFYKGMAEKERDEAAGGYYNHNTRMARDSMCQRDVRRKGNDPRPHCRA